MRGAQPAGRRRPLADLGEDERVLEPCAWRPARRARRRCPRCGGSCPAGLRVLAGRLGGHWKILYLAPLLALAPLAWRPRRRPSRCATAAMYVGCTIGRFSMILSTRPSTAVTCPTSMAGGEHLAEDVGERQPAGTARRRGRSPVEAMAFAMYDQLSCGRRTARDGRGGTGGVDEGGELVGGDHADALLDQLRVLLQVRGTRVSRWSTPSPVSTPAASMTTMWPSSAARGPPGPWRAGLRSPRSGPCCRSRTMTPTPRRSSAGRSSSWPRPRTGCRGRRSTSIDSTRVEEASATRCSGRTPSSISPAAMA